MGQQHDEEVRSASDTGEDTMLAMVQHEYGPPDVLELQTVPRTSVGDDDVLVEVRATSVNPADWHRTTGTPFIVRLMGAGLSGPKQATPGADVAGRVAAVGRNVKHFQVGDEVFGEISSGAYAEFVSVSEDLLAPKPANMTFEQAAAVPVAALTALQGLRDHGEVKPGDHVLINGASGGVGTFAVQIAKALGAEVTAVCSTRNVEMVLAIGADHVIDYTTEGFTEAGRRFDVLLDNVGNRSLSDCRGVLTPGGKYVMVGGPKGKLLGPVPRMLTGLVTFLFASQDFRWFVATPTRNDLDALKDLIEAGSITPVIDREYVLAEIPEALRYLGEGHSRGKSVVTVAEQGTT